MSRGEGRLMSVAFTADQVEARIKTQTRRKGWRFLNPGDHLQLCRKVMGRRAGEPVDVLARVKVVAVRREPLDWITPSEVAREGFPGMSRHEFINRFFVQAQGMEPTDWVTVIDWEYLS